MIRYGTDSITGVQVSHNETAYHRLLQICTVVQSHPKRALEDIDVRQQDYVIVGQLKWFPECLSSCAHTKHHNNR